VHDNIRIIACGLQAGVDLGRACCDNAFRALPMARLNSVKITASRSENMPICKRDMKWTHNGMKGNLFLWLKSDVSE
jgi:hypothetical protein